MFSGWHKCLGARLPRIFQINGTVFKNELCSRDCAWVTCFLRRFAVYGRGSAAELAVESWSSVLHVTLWRRHLQNLSFKVVLSGGTAMIQGTNEHVANDLTELFLQLENEEVAASPERKYSLMSRRIHLVLCLHFPAKRKSTSNLAQQCPQQCFKAYHRMLTLSVAWYTSIVHRNIHLVFSPALSSRGGFRLEGTTNRGPSLFVPQSCMVHVDVRHTFLSHAVETRLVCYRRLLAMQVWPGQHGLQLGCPCCRNSCTKAKQL